MHYMPICERETTTTQLDRHEKIKIVFIRRTLHPFGFHSCVVEQVDPLHTWAGNTSGAGGLDIQSPLAWSLPSGTYMYSGAHPVGRIAPFQSIVTLNDFDRSPRDAALEKIPEITIFSSLFSFFSRIET
jgi:hypothetical protein